MVVCGLLMELNSIFLHSRSMLNLYRVDKSSTPFRIIALLNIVTFIIFRMAVSTYLLYWQITTAWKMVWYLILVTFVVIVSLAITNIVLLYRQVFKRKWSYTSRKGLNINIEHCQIALNVILANRNVRGVKLFQHKIRSAILSPIFYQSLHHATYYLSVMWNLI